ncbi:MAG: retroviral-like aspartic protease family protein [Blastocatellia bacterium]
MGKIYTTITVTNRIDQANAEDGVISPEKVRSITLSDVLVDTGATTLCLPKDVIAQLGLKPLRRVPVETAAGVMESNVFQDAKLSLLGREGTFECLELPGGRKPLLGVIPMEALGIEPELHTQSLRLLPLTEQDTYLTIL